MALKNPKTIPGSSCLGVITGARGLKGEVKIKPFGDDPMTMADYGDLHDGQGNRLTIKPKSLTKGMLMAMIEGVMDRSQADALKGTALYIERDRLPEPDDDEFYHSDLIGLGAETKDGESLGYVRGVYDFGAGDVLELSGSDHGVVMVPFTKACVPEVSIAEARVIIDPPPGLLEPGEPEPADGGTDD